MKKCILSIIISVVMILGMLSITAFADDATVTSTKPQNINYDTKTIEVTNADELLWITEYSAASQDENIPTTFQGWTIYFPQDITWPGTEWTPITNFHGKMSGATNEDQSSYITISGLKVTDVASNAAFCGGIEYNESSGAPYFENICISGSTFTATGSYAGAFAGNGYTASFKNCHVFDCEIYANRFVGGIVGTTYGEINGCTVKGTTKSNMTVTAKTDENIAGTGDNAGGIVGLMGEGGAKVIDCDVDNVTIHATRQAGGNYGNEISGCTVSNAEIKVYLNYNGSFFGRSAAAGGICGQIEPSDSGIITITKNTVGPDVSVSKANGNNNYCGWVLGDATRGTNYSVSGNTYIGTPTIPEVYGAN